MRMKNIVIFSVALLYLLAGSASAAVDFPADEAGISAYVKAKDNVDLNLTKSAFASIERETPDYIIGTVEMWGHTEEQRPHVYVSKDGWVVAYYTNERPSGWIMPWGDYAGGPLSSTTLSKSVGIVANAVGGTTNGLKYYDFRYPDATKMMIIVEFGNTDFFKMKIPTTISTYAVDWSLYKTSCSYCGNGYAYLDGALFGSTGNGGRAYGSLLGQIQNGIEYTIKITVNDGGDPRLGLVLEYAE
jgi:hypothetical protein